MHTKREQEQRKKYGEGKGKQAISDKQTRDRKIKQYKQLNK